VTVLLMAPGTGQWRYLVLRSAAADRSQRVVSSPTTARQVECGWGAGAPAAPTTVLEFLNGTFQGNPNSGGFNVADGTFVRFINKARSGNVGTRLLYCGDKPDSVIRMVDEQGLAEIVGRGWGSGNRLGPSWPTCPQP